MLTLLDLISIVDDLWVTEINPLELDKSTFQPSRLNLNGNQWAFGSYIFPFVFSSDFNNCKLISLLQNGQAYIFSLSSFFFDSIVVRRFFSCPITCSPMSSLISKVFCFSPQFGQNFEFSPSSVLHFTHSIGECVMGGIYKSCRRLIGDRSFLTNLMKDVFVILIHLYLIPYSK